MSSGLALEMQRVHGAGWKQYPAYRDSGVEWLGAVPEGWSVKRLKYCAARINETVDGRESDLPYTGLEHIESWTGRLTPIEEISTSEGQSSRYEPGDVLFGKLRPYLAKAFRANELGICTGELLVLRPKDVSQDYLFSYILARDFISIVDSSTYGAKMPRASWDFIGDLPILLPSEAEQRAIAAFLDRETGRIDALIAKKERQIELLQEKRAALISHAVTKGLDPDAPMKDSGVEWLGEVPEHWNILALRRVVSRFVDYRGKTPEKVDRGVPLITAKNIKDGHVDLSQSQEFMREDEYQDWMTRGWPEIGDVLITTEAPLGAVAQVEDTFIALAQRIILLKVNKSRIINDYLKYHFLSMSGQGELWTRASGSTALGIKAERFKGTLVSVPPLNEQQKITRYLDSEISRLEIPSSKIRESITKLREYRTAIISAAVTGKIDVREESAP